MTTLQHPHIHPPLRIEVEDERVPEHVEAGWLPVEPDPDPDQPGEDHDPERTPA